MTLSDLAARITSIPDSQVILVMERASVSNMLYLTSNLRSALQLHDAEINASKDQRRLFVTRSDGSEVRLDVVAQKELVENPSKLAGYRGGTRLFCESRSGFHESQL